MEEAGDRVPVWHQLSPSQQQLRQETDRFSDAVVAEGTIASGALLGGVLGALVGGEDATAGAAIGAGAGAASGARSGYFVASQNRPYATEEARLDAEIEAAQQEVASNQRIVSAAQLVVEEHQRDIAQGRAQYLRAQITIDEYNEQFTRAEFDARLIEEAIEHNQIQTEAIGQRANELRREDREASALENALSELNRHRETLEMHYDDLLEILSARQAQSG